MKINIFDEKKILNKDDSLFNAPTFNLSHEENLDSFQTFKTALKRLTRYMYIKKSEVLKGGDNKVIKLNVNQY